MNTKKLACIKLVLCSCTFLWVSLKAQNTLLTPLSLKEMVQSSASNNPSLRIKQAQIAVGTANVEDAKHAWIPSVRVADQITVGSDNGLSGPYFSLGFVPSISGGRRPVNKSDLAAGNLAALVAEWEVYNFGSYAARQKDAEAGLQINQADLEREKYTVQWLVVQQYFDLMLYRQMMAVQQRNMQRAAEMKTIIAALVGSGLKPGADTSLATAELSKLRLDYLDTERAYALSRNQLAFFTAKDLATIEPDTNLAALLPKMLLLASAPEMNTNNHPELAYTQALYAKDLTQGEALRKSTMPKIMLMGAGMLRGSSISPDDHYDDNILTGLGYTRSNYILGAAISYNLTDPLKVKYKRNIQQAQTEVTRQNLELQQAMLNNNLLRTDIQLKTTMARLQEIPYQLRASSDAYQQKLALYNSGLSNIADLTSALYLLNRAELDKVLAQNAAWRAVIDKLSTSAQLPLFLSNLP